MATLEVASQDSAQHTKVRVHPVVLMSIVDLYSRREEGQDRVVGALLGTLQDNFFDVCDSFAVPFELLDPSTPTIDGDYFAAMLQLHQRVDRKQVVLGWYSTGSCIDELGGAFLPFFQPRSHRLRPIHLLLDATLSCPQRGFQPQTFLTRPVLVGDKYVGAQFSPVRTSTVRGPAEQVGLESLVKFDNARLQADKDAPSVISDFDSLSRSVQQMLTTLSEVESYVEDVLEEKRSADPEVGRALLQIVQSVDTISPKELDEMISGRVQDMLMMHFLGDVSKTQTALAERLESMCT